MTLSPGSEPNPGRRGDHAIRSPAAQVFTTLSPRGQAPTKITFEKQKGLGAITSRYPSPLTLPDTISKHVVEQILVCTVGPAQVGLVAAYLLSCELLRCDVSRRSGRLPLPLLTSALRAIVLLCQ